MKRVMNRALAALAAVAAVACSAPEERIVTGKVMEATADALLVTHDKMITVFNIGKADLSEAWGLPAGAPVTVTYTVSKKMFAASRVVCDKTYAGLIGSWVHPVPGNEQESEGIELQPKGAAASINRATLLYETWGLSEDGRLVLTGKSVGNGQTIDFADTVEVVRLDDTELVLSSASGFEERYTRR
ncbi:MAG: lipocalin family protein [Rikenellaceae bacterium]|nr:lipocalin family protein [Rikenellaceae bacterium]